MTCTRTKKITDSTTTKRIESEVFQMVENILDFTAG